MSSARTTPPGIRADGTASGPWTPYARATRDLHLRTGELSEPEGLFWRAMPFDPDLYRAAMEIISALTLPRDIYARPGVLDRAEAVVNGLPVGTGPVPEPSRADLVAALA